MMEFRYDALLATGSVFGGIVESGTNVMDKEPCVLEVTNRNVEAEEVESQYLQ
jgi:hypothetical protein